MASGSRAVCEKRRVESTLSVRKQPFPPQQNHSDGCFPAAGALRVADARVFFATLCMRVSLLREISDDVSF